MTPSHFIFVAGDIYDEERLVRAQEICQALLERQVWLIWRETPYQRDYRVGDRVLFYLARSGKCEFAGAAELASEPEPASQNEVEVGKSLGLIGYDRRLRLRHVRMFQERVPIRPLIQELTFIKDKHWWGHWFRQSAMRIPEKDFERVLAEVSK